MLRLSNSPQKPIRHIRGAGGQETVDDDADALLALIAGHYAGYAGKLTIGDADALAFAEAGYHLGRDDDVSGVCIADDSETGHLAIRDNEGNVDRGAAYVGATIVETEEGEADIVIDENFQFVFCASGKKDVGYAWFHYGGPLAVNDLDSLHKGKVGFHTM